MVNPVDIDTQLSTRSRVKRDQIIQAALLLFLEKGFERTSMEAIRQEAQVSKPTLYNHFEDKEKLFIGVIENAVEDITNTWELESSNHMTITNQEELQTILIGFASAAIDHLLSRQTIKLARTLLEATRTFPHLGLAFRKRVPQRVFSLVSALLTSAHAQGVVSIRKEEIPSAARLFASQLLSYLLLDGLLIADAPPEKPSNDELEMMIDLYMGMIC